MLDLLLFTSAKLGHLLCNAKLKYLCHQIIKNFKEIFKNRMKEIALLIVLWISVYCNAQNISIRTDSAFVHFTFVSKKTEGEIREVSAKIEVDYFNIFSSKISGKAMLSSFTTNNKMRDKHLLSKEYFDADQYPYISFTSEKIVKKGEMFVVEGILTMKGVSKQIEFQIVEHPNEIVFKSTIFSADFGIEIMKKREKSKVIVAVHIPLLE